MAARDGVPIKVKIGLKPDRTHDFPQWDTLPLQAVDGEDHRDHQIVKWRYDQSSGHDDDSVDSPAGEWYGMMIVTRKFADQAIAAWPTLVTEMTEAEAQAFWQDKCHMRTAENDIDTDHLTGLQAQRALMVDLAQDTTAIDAQITNALNPDHSERGVRKNREKMWADAKTKLGFAMEARVRPT